MLATWGYREVEGEVDLCPKANSPPLLTSKGKELYRWREGGSRQNSSQLWTCILKLVVGGLINAILNALGTVSLQFHMLVPTSLEASSQNFWQLMSWMQSSLMC